MRPRPARRHTLALIPTLVLAKALNCLRKRTTHRAGTITTMCTITTYITITTTLALHRHPLFHHSPRFRLFTPTTAHAGRHRVTWNHHVCPRQS
jgi:hypothetical protein